MAEDRPEKRAMREVWLGLVEGHQIAAERSNVPLLLALPGAEGRDIDLLVERGVITLTETGAIAEDDFGKIVAVESSDDAYLALRHKYPGLNVLQQRVADLVRSPSPIAWPQGEHIQFCRARVVNLDLNEPLNIRTHQGQIVFPALAVVSKLAQLHARDPSVEWSL